MIPWWLLLGAVGIRRSGFSGRTLIYDTPHSKVSARFLCGLSTVVQFKGFYKS